MSFMDNVIIDIKYERDMHIVVDYFERVYQGKYF